MDKCIDRSLCKKPTCTAKYIDDENAVWYCTRKARHTGCHIACGTRTHNYFRWANNTEPEGFFKRLLRRLS